MLQVTTESQIDGNELKVLKAILVVTATTKVANHCTGDGDNTSNDKNGDYITSLLYIWNLEFCIQIEISLTQEINNVTGVVRREESCSKFGYLDKFILMESNGMW